MPRIVPPSFQVRPGDVTQRTQDPPDSAKPSALFERVLWGLLGLSRGARPGLIVKMPSDELRHAPKASKIGASIWCVEGLDALPAISQTLAGKATSTILKRARFSAKYIRECTALHITAFPVSIKAFIAFLKPLVSKGESSAIREAAETINFLEHVLGMEVEEDLLEHPWIKGALRGANIRKSDPRRSRVLTTEEVLLLEGALIDELLDKVDAFALGVFLFQLYARARVSDLRNIAKLELDLTDGQGFIEVRTYDHKNCRLNSPGACLILVAPYKGIHSKPWGAAWVKAANAVGFNFEKGHHGPLLPRQAVDYSWSSEAISASETTAWVREILMHLGVNSESACVFSSHGLKATTLSWVSKAGYSERTQLVLGHHSLGPSGKTQEAYARKVQAQPLRDLVECLNAIQRGVFLPDRTRSGMMAPGASVSAWRFSAPPEQAQSVSPEACVGAPVNRLRTARNL